MDPTTMQTSGPKTPPAQTVLAAALLAEAGDAQGLELLLEGLTPGELVEVARNAAATIAIIVRLLAGEEHVERVLQCLLAEVAHPAEGG